MWIWLIEPAAEWGRTMWLMPAYIFFILIGDVVAYFIALIIEKPQLIGISTEQPATTTSLTVFLALYFLNLWVAWRIAVKVTEPKAAMA
jgi:hypothetical protein